LKTILIRNKKKKIKKMLIKVMATHELLAKNFFEVHLKIKAILLS
jgi:hypothetical protein